MEDEVSSEDLAAVHDRVRARLGDYASPGAVLDELNWMALLEAGAPEDLRATLAERELTVRLAHLGSGGR